MSAFLEKQREIRQGYIDAAERITRQLMADCMVVMLHEQFGFGYTRCRAAMDGVLKIYDKYHLACEGKAESDNAQDRLDDELRKIVGDNAEFFCFRERYPEIKELSYKGRRDRT